MCRMKRRNVNKELTNDSKKMAMFWGTSARVASSHIAHASPKQCQMDGRAGAWAKADRQSQWIASVGGMMNERLIAQHAGLTDTTTTCPFQTQAEI